MDASRSVDGRSRHGATQRQLRPLDDRQINDDPVQLKGTAPVGTGTRVAVDDELCLRQLSGRRRELRLDDGNLRRMDRLLHRLGQ